MAGCTTTDESCNGGVLAGVFAKIDVDPVTEGIEIRFVSLTDNGNNTSTYNDGEKSFVVDEFGFGPNGEALAADLTGAYYSVNLYGFVSDSEFVDGILGAPTDASVIPVEGLASYSGNAFIAFGNYDSASAEYGTSTLEVNFAASDADLTIDLDEFDASITAFDQIVANDMVIDGYTFTGDEAVLLLEIEPDVFVDVTNSLTGANTDSAAAGMFFGPVNADGNPEEFGAVAVVGGDDGFVYGLAEGQVAPVVD